MPARPASARPGQGRSRLKGCLIAAGIALGVVALLAAIAAGIAAWQFNRLRREFTDAELKPLPVTQVDGDSAKRLTRTAEQFARALNDNRPGQFTFTEAQLNGLLAMLPDTQELRGRATVAIAGDRLRVQTGVPLEQVPGFQGRYLNAEFTVDAQVTNGQLQVYVREVTVRGKPLPPLLVDRLRTQNLADRLLQDPGARRFFSHIRTLRVAEGAVQVETGL